MWKRSSQRRALRQVSQLGKPYRVVVAMRIPGIASTRKSTGHGRKSLLLSRARAYRVGAQAAPRVRPTSSLAQQFVDAGLAARALVHLLDDDCRIQAVAAVGGRQAPGNDHAARGHAAVTGLAGGTVVDARGLAEEDAHADHAAALDHHALHHFRAC